MPDLGELRDRVTIQSKTPTTDAQGGRAQAWSDLATVWAAIAPYRWPSEALQAAMMGSQVSWTVEIRYRADVTALMRISWTPYGASAARTLEIHGVTLKDGRRDRLLLECAEVV